MKFTRLRPSAGTAIALVALFVALGGVGVAATGGNFILGQPNTADKTTALSSSVATGPTLELTNTAGKPAARFNVSGTSPFSVSNAKKVQNLNADQLDGLDSTGFIQGSGKSHSAALTLAPVSGSFPLLLSVPGLGEFTATCIPGTNPLGGVDFKNTTSGTIDLTYLSIQKGSTVSTNVSGVILPPGTTASGDSEAYRYFSYSANTTTWQLSTADGSKVGTAFTSILFDGSGNCVFRASYVEST